MLSLEDKIRNLHSLGFSIEILEEKKTSLTKRTTKRFTAIVYSTNREAAFGGFGFTRDEAIEQAADRAILALDGSTRGEDRRTE